MNRGSHTQVEWAGYGLVLGAGLGLVAGLVFFNSYVWLLLIGATLGLIVGSVIDLRARM